MAAQYYNYSPSSKSKADSTVREIQAMLNRIRTQYHLNWEYLSEDGIYGPKTAQAVKVYQIYRGITPASGVLGPTTIDYIADSYKRIPVITAQSSSLKPYYDTQGLADKSFLVKAIDAIGAFLSNTNDFVKGEIRYVNSLGRLDAGALKNRYVAFATRFDPKMKELKQLLGKNTVANDTIAKNMALAKQPGFGAKSSVAELNIRAAQRAVSKSKQAIRINTRQAQRASLDLIGELKKFDVLSKIEKFLASKGITGRIELSALKSKPGITIKGGGLLVLLNLKDLIYDLCQVDEWGTEAWKAKIVKHFFEFLDDIVVGFASFVLAQLIVGAVVGASISAGWIAVIVAIVAILIAALITYFMDEAEVSFSETALEGYKSIVRIF